MVSAFYGITDKLMFFVKSGNKNENEIELFIRQLHNQKLEIIFRAKLTNYKPLSEKRYDN